MYSELDTEEVARPVFGPDDDHFHFDVMSGDWWDAETSWWSFAVPERNMGGWLYTMMRPTIGIVAGGAWLWDDAASLPWKVLYYQNYSALPLPASLDPKSATYPNGVSTEVLEAGKRYRLGYSDPGRFEASLDFSGIMEPFGIASFRGSNNHHFDQLGKVNGKIVVHGDEIEVDCLAMRDRSWGIRAETRPPLNAYVTGAIDENNGFLAITKTSEIGEPAFHGFILRDGRIAALSRGNRQVNRDPDGGWITRIQMSLLDESDRRLEAIGTPVSRIMIDRRTFVDCNSLMYWEFDDGRSGWGEDQDCWPMNEWPRNIGL